MEINKTDLNKKFNDIDFELIQNYLQSFVGKYYGINPVNNPLTSYFYGKIDSVMLYVSGAITNAGLSGFELSIEFNGDNFLTFTDSDEKNRLFIGDSIDEVELEVELSK